MKIINSIVELKAAVKQAKQAGMTVGFVPTMGYLHEGHLSLMRAAKKENGLVVASIFVNPLQFGPTEDYAVYPRNLERDAELAKSAGVDIVFAPSVAEMYPQGYQNMNSYVDLTDITDKLCGKQRPGHFRGVATVVSKLFNIVEPTYAYFGQKDAQQVIVLKKMVCELNMNVIIRVLPIVREADGLAMSSRNVYLEGQQRQAALVLNHSLCAAKQMLEQGEKDAALIRGTMCQLISRQPLAAIDYVEIVDLQNLQPVQVVAGSVLIALAVRIGKVRLIDNLLWEE